MLANINQQDLIDHLHAVALVARTMGEKLGIETCVQAGSKTSLMEDIYTAALLHDIGKADLYFQKYLASMVDTTTPPIVDEDFPNESINTGHPLHHEIGWAHLTTVTGNERVLNAVYWHHARPIHTVDNKFKTYECANDIKEKVSASSLKALNALLNTLKPFIPANYFGDIRHNRIDVPDLFNKDDGTYNDNAEFMLVRACVISADRYVSSLTAEEASDIAKGRNDIAKTVDDMLAGSVNGDIVLPNGYDAWRFDLQKEIAERVSDSRTTIVKAPAGLGKTLIGLLWTKARGSRVIWVCPRNAVADAVYENILKEVNNLGLDCTIELYRTGKRQSTNREDNRPEFCSDIIVTNIDTLMSPMVNNTVAHRLFAVYGAHVVLDEFHEFVSDAPLFAAFITYMRARHRVANNCKTLLLSATPSLIHILWDNSEQKTAILPDDIKHYPPQHSGKYSVNLESVFPSRAQPGSVLVCNAVSEAQNNYKRAKYTHIIHHRFTDCDRKNKEDAIKQSFGKNGSGVVNGESLSAALVIQAAMDISFRNLFDSVSSPESTLQRIGRTDRWGTYQNLNPSITFMDMSSENTERGAISTVYDRALQAEWYEFLKENLSSVSEVNLEAMYGIYNDFYNKYATEIKRYLLKQYKIGMNGPSKKEEFLGLVKFEPVKLLNSEPNKNSKSSHKNLRNPDSSYYYTVQLDEQPNVWLNPDDVLSEGYELYKRYEKPDLFVGLNDSGTMQARLKGLVVCGYAAWTRHSKGKMKIPIGFDWFKKARNPETPLPDFSRKYNSELGVINK